MIKFKMWNHWPVFNFNAFFSFSDSLSNIPLFFYFYRSDNSLIFSSTFALMIFCLWLYSNKYMPSSGSSFKYFFFIMLSLSFNVETDLDLRLYQLTTMDFAFSKGLSWTIYLFFITNNSFSSGLFFGGGKAFFFNSGRLNFRYE